MRYAPEFWLREDIPQAKIAIMGIIPGPTVEQRWVDEIKLLMDYVRFDPGLVVDYGCGIGRIAKELPNPVLGVDISPTMRRHAQEYVQRAEFSTVSPEIFKSLIDGGLRVRGLLTFWSLVHTLEIEECMDLLMKALTPGGIWWYIDVKNRSIPFKSGKDFIFMNDGYEVLPNIEKYCHQESEIPLEIGDLRKFVRK